MKPLLCVGGRSYRKQKLWGYCFEHFNKEELWLLDSLPVFDPFWLARQDTARTRQLLKSIRISRPFTFYQLRDKLYSLTRLPLTHKSTVIVSGMDAFDEELQDERELRAIQLAMGRLLVNLPCKCILGIRKPNELFGGVVWAEQ